jgi:phytoene desaturase
MSQKTVAVVGAGIAGLASAIRLANQGLDVHLFEKNSYTGGKMTVYKQDGFRFDAGPSLFTLPELVDELFKLCGKNPRDYFNYTKHHTACCYYWSNGKSITLTADQAENLHNIERVFGAKESRSAKRYFEHSEEKYELTAPYFLEKSLHRKSTFSNWEVLKVVQKIPSLGIFSSLNALNGKYFESPELVQLFNRYATYNGSNPYKTPGIMQMINHLEHGIGTYLPKGGMHEIAKSLTKLAREVGVNIYLNTPVLKVCTENNAFHSLLVNGEYREFDSVVLNSDVHHTYAHLMDDKVPRPKRTLAQKPSTSALIFYWGIQQTFKQLDLHNIFFSKDYKKEFDNIDSNEGFWMDPTIYVNISCKLEEDDAPEGCENWFVMVNVPPNTGQDWVAIREKTKASIMERLSQELEVNLEELIVTERVLDPVLIEKYTSSAGGALYGTSSDNQLSAFLRHPNKKLGKYSGLYFCGGSAHPGGGIPLCLHSAKLAADWCIEDLVKETKPRDVFESLKSV